ncbi:hypothetical protein [Cecembia rubra]|uniref:Phage-Barnase-EndoU-ColicinE5/D-RelE like nuclease 2 domain-containing protein n=1 Tax=Cecembia rubra TaxID=1485585 RepID=A0A2P8E2Y1_9BACT|nr:hypothetical protein [Cecembia rubra]PSL03825.1 hypothetical protein CLV48_10664 [Cecembia rubra]
MPLNLLKIYNELLDLIGLGPHERNRSLRGVFNRDFIDLGQPSFNGKPIYPTPKEGEIEMDTLFAHLTTVVVDQKTKQREFELKRSVRLHWVRHHLDQRKDNEMLTFSVKEPEGVRTYIYDKTESYVVILEPLRDRSAYYLLTAFHVEGKDANRNKFEKKWRRRLDTLL